jgi:hypothetical protein
LGEGDGKVSFLWGGVGFEGVVDYCFGTFSCF